MDGSANHEHDANEILASDERIQTIIHPLLLKSVTTVKKSRPSTAISSFIHASASTVDCGGIICVTSDTCIYT